MSAPRILISRLSAIGDVLHTVPVMCAIRDTLPDAFIGWVVEGRNGELLRGHPALDELIVVKRGWLKAPSALMSLRRQLRGLRFDIAIDVQGLTKSAVASWLSGARQRIGYGDVDGREFSPWLNNVRVTPTGTHVVERNLELLRPLGIEQPSVRFDLPETAADAAMAEECWSPRISRQGGSEFRGWEPAEAGTPARRFAIINPGAGWKSKLWPRERFAAVAKYLGEQQGVPSLVVWAPGEEQAWAEEIVEKSAKQAWLAPKTSLTELTALCRRAALFISSDTGPLHIAAAVGTPCVGLFGPMPAERNGPYGSQHIAIQEMTLSGRSRDRRNAGPESMEAISIERVCGACETILTRTSQTPQPHFQISQSRQSRSNLNDLAGLN